MHPRIAKKLGETDERLFAVAAWRDTPYFTDAERAALALTEAVTRLSDRADPVPDDIWDEAARHYDEQGARRARSQHRRHQRVEPAERHDPAGRRRRGVVMAIHAGPKSRRSPWLSTVPGTVAWNSSAKTSTPSSSRLGYRRRRSASVKRRRSATMSSLVATGLNM